MKTLAMYMRTMRTEAEEAGISTEGMAESTAKLRDELLALTGGQLDIQIDDSHLKSTFQVLQELSEIWDDIGKVSENNQARILEMLGGKRNANVLSSIITNFEDAIAAMETAGDSAGSAWIENEKYLESIEGKTKQVQAAFEAFANSVIDSDIVKTWLDISKGILNAGSALNEVGALLPTIAAGLTVIKGIIDSIKASTAANQIMTYLNAGNAANSDAIQGVIANLTKGQQKALAINIGNLIQTEGATQGLQEVANLLQRNVGVTNTLKSTFISMGTTVKTVISGIKASLMSAGIAALISLAISGITKLVQWISTAKERAIEAAQEVNQAYTDQAKSTSDNISSLKKLEKEYNELNAKAGANGTQGSLNADEFERYKKVISEIASISPGVVAGFTEEGAALKDYNGVIQDAIGYQEQLLTNQKRILVNDADTVYSGARAQISDLYDEMKKYTYQIYDAFSPTHGNILGNNGVQEAKNWLDILDSVGIKLDEIVEKTGNTNVEYHTSRISDVWLRSYDYLEQLADKQEEIRIAMLASGNYEADQVSDVVNKIANLSKILPQYESYVKSVQNVLLAYADTDEGLLKILNHDDLNAKQLDVYYEGIKQIADASKTFGEQKESVKEFTKLFADVYSDIDWANGAGTFDGLWSRWGELQEKYKEFPYLLSLIKDALFGVSDAEKQNSDATEKVVQSYENLEKILSKISGFNSFLNKARNGSDDPFGMISSAKDLAEAYNEIMKSVDGFEEIDWTSMTNGTDANGNIVWDSSKIEEYIKAMIEASVSNTDFANKYPDVVNALKNTATAFDEAKDSVTGFSDALGAAQKVADVTELMGDFTGTDAERAELLEQLDGILSVWNEFSKTKYPNRQPYTIQDMLGVNGDDFELMNTMLDKFKREMVADFMQDSGLSSDNWLVKWLLNASLAEEETAKKTYKLADAMSALSSVSKFLTEGFDTTNPLSTIDDALGVLEDWNAALKSIGMEGNKTLADLIVIDDKGAVTEKVGALKAVYKDLATAAIEANKELSEVEKEALEGQIDSWINGIFDSEKIKAKTNEIKDAFSKIKEIMDYSSALADYRKFDSSVSYFDMLEKMYDLVEKYDDISISDLWDFDSSSFKDIGDLQLDKQLDKLAKELKINEDEVESWKDHVKKSFEAAKEAVSAYETASKSINLASSLNSFLADYRSGDKNTLSMLSSAVSLAEELGVKLEDIVKVGSDGKLTFEVSGLTDAFETYIDSLVEAKQLNADLAAQIKNAARAEGELADKAAEAAEHMADMLSKMQGLYSFAEAGTAGETDILSVLKNAQEQFESYRADFEKGLVTQPLSIFDFIDMSGGDAKENVSTAKKVYKEYADELVDSWIKETKRVNAENGADVMSGFFGADEWANGLTGEQAAFFEQIRAKIVAELNKLDAEVEPTVGDIIDNLQTLVDFESKVGTSVDFSSVWDDLESLKTILGNDKLTLNDIIDWQDGDFVYKTDLLSGKIKELSNTIATELVDAEIAGGAEIEDRTAAIEERAKRIQASLTGVADTWGQLTSTISSVKSIQSVREDYNSYIAGDMSLLDMLSSATSLAETLGISLDDAFSIGADGEMVLNIEAMENGLVGVIDNLEKSGVCSANLASQLRAAARAEAQVETNAEKINKAYSNFNDANSFGSGLTRGQQLTYEDYQSMIERDARYAESVEYVNGVMSVNRDKYNEITAAIANETAELALLEAAQRKLKIDEYQKELDTNTKLTNEERSAIEKQIAKLKLEANGYTVLANEIANATNQFERFRNASGNADADTYMDAQSALTMLEDVLYNTESELYGQLGNDKFQEAVKLLIDPEFDFKEGDVKAAYEALREKLNRYFGEGTDDNPQTSRTNMFSFWQDLQEKGFVGIDEQGYGYLDSTKANVEDIAKAFGLTKDAARAALQELEQWSQTDFDWEHIDPEYYEEVLKKAEELAKTAEKAKATAEDLTKKAEDARKTADEAAAKLEEAKKSGDQSQIDAAEAVANEAEQSAQAAEKARDEANAAAEQAAQAAADAKKTDNEKLAENLQSIIDQVEQIKNTPVEIDATQAIESTTSVVEQLQAMVDLLAEMQRINAELAEIGATTDEAQEKVDTLGESEVDVDTTPAINSVSELMDYIVQAENDVADLSSMDIFLDSNPAVESIQSVLDALAVLSKAIDDVNSKSIKTPPSSSGGGGDGGGGDSGGSGARGITSSPGGRTLVGELGREIVVDVNSGRWYTVGNNGPEMVNLPKNAIVYNARKTEELLGKRTLDLSGFSMAGGSAINAAGTNNNSSVGGGRINIDALATPLEQTSKTTSSIAEEVEDAVDVLEQIAEAYELANDTLEHLIEHEEFNYYKAERAANFDGMNTYLANEIELYKAIMKNSQEGIEELKRNGADDGNEYLQELEEAYWDAYKSMYEALDNIRSLYTDALSDEIDNIQSAYKELVSAASEYNDRGQISLDTFQAILDNGIEYLGILEDENGELSVNKNTARDLLKVRRDQLAIETAISYVDRLNEALTNGEVQKVAELVEAKGQIGRSSWDIVYANLAALKAQGLSNEQYEKALENIQKLQELANVAMDEFDSEDKIAEAKSKFEDLNKELEHYIEHQKFAFDVGDRDMNFTAMNQALEKEVGYYKRIMEEAQRTIAEMTALGADDTNESLQSVEESYWSAYRSMYNVLDQIRQLRVDALSTRLDGLTKSFSNLKNAADEYNKAQGISLDTFQSLLDDGLQYMSLLEEQNGQYVIAKDRVNQLIDARKNQLAVESALSYISQVREALETGATERLQNLLDATDAVTNSTWGYVYAQAALLKASMSDAQYKAFIANIDKMKALADSVIYDYASSEGDVTEEYEKQADALDDILRYTEELIRAETKDRIDAINDEIDAYKEIIKLKKESLDTTKEENEYQDGVAEKVKEIAELQSKADLLALDTSRSANAERQKLLQEIADKQKDLAKYQNDYAIDAQKEALDKEAEDYEEARKIEIEALEKTISSEEKVYKLAIARIRDQWDTLYADLIAWNTEQGSVINQEITDAWEAAARAVEKYGSAIEALKQTKQTGENLVVADIPKYHSGGEVGNEGSINKDEVLAVLQKGELVATNPMKKVIYSAVDFVKSLSEKIGANAEAIRRFTVDNVASKIAPAFAMPAAEPYAVGNTNVAFSASFNVAVNGADLGDNDPKTFGRAIASAAADDLFEAFNRRGINSIRTLRQ